MPGFLPTCAEKMDLRFYLFFQNGLIPDREEQIILEYM